MAQNLRVTPHFAYPGMVLDQVVQTGAHFLLGGKTLEDKIPAAVKAVYVSRMRIATQARASMNGYANLPGVDVVRSEMSTPVTSIRMRTGFTSSDETDASAAGYSLQEAHRLGARQGVALAMRNGLLYGFGDGGGLVNNAIQASLPPDQLNATTVSTYDNGSLFFFMMQQIAARKVATNQTMTPGLRVVVCAPQRFIAHITGQAIVQTVAIQRQGAGTGNVATLLDDNMRLNDGAIEFVIDDSLQNAGGAGIDYVMISIPEVKTQVIAGGLDVNAFGTLAPNLASSNIMLTRNMVPTEYITPNENGGMNTMYESFCTSGWAIRPEATVRISMPY